MADELVSIPSISIEPQTKNKPKIEAKKRRRYGKLRLTSSGAIKQTTRLDLFLEEFLKNGGNGTKAAMTVFGYTNKMTAATVSAKYLKKARSISRLYMEQKGYTWGRLLEIIVHKIEESKTPEFLDRFLRIVGYGEMIEENKKASPTSGNIINIIQTEKGILSKYTDEEIEDVEPLPLDVIAENNKEEENKKQGKAESD